MNLPVNVRRDGETKNALRGVSNSIPRIEEGVAFPGEMRPLKDVQSNLPVTEGLPPMEDLRFGQAARRSDHGEGRVMPSATRAWKSSSTGEPTPWRTSARRESAHELRVRRWFSSSVSPRR